MKVTEQKITKVYSIELDERDLKTLMEEHWLIAATRAGLILELVACLIDHPDD